MKTGGFLQYSTAYPTKAELLWRRWIRQYYVSVFKGRNILAQVNFAFGVRSEEMEAFKALFRRGVGLLCCRLVGRLILNRDMA